LTLVRLLQLDQWEMTVDLEEPVVVGSGDPIEAGGFDMFDGAPGAAAADQLGLG
jgi:hypothetical protein